MTTQDPHWWNKHPIEQLAKYGSQSKYVQRFWENDCRNILHSATIRVGRAIQDALAKEIRKGTLQVLGRPSQSPFDEPKPVPPTVFLSSFILDLFHNTITFGGGDAKISSVSILYIGYNSTKETRPNSFKSADLILVEEMKRLIDESEVSSIEKAVKQVLPKAMRQVGASDDSVIDRLRRRFGGKYPHFMKRKRRTDDLILSVNSST